MAEHEERKQRIRPWEPPLTLAQGIAWAGFWIGLGLWLGLDALGKGLS